MIAMSSATELLLPVCLLLILGFPFIFSNKMWPTIVWFGKTFVMITVGIIDLEAGTHSFAVSRDRILFATSPSAISI